MDWWNEEVSYVYIYNDVIYTDCTEKIEDGVIRFQQGDQERMEKRDAAGATYNRFNFRIGSLNKMRYAEIGLLDYGSFDVVIRHEIGHAFGWGHMEDPNSLMYFQLNTVMSPEGLDEYPEME